MSTENILTRLLFPKPAEPPKPVPSGLYHYMRSAGQESYSAGAYTRFHLRVDPDGRGLLLANASAALHLSPTGVVIAKGLLDDLDKEAIVARLKASFHGASQQRMEDDLERVAALIAALVAPGDNYPVMNLEDAAISPYEAQLMAPLQADVVAASPSHIFPILNNLWQAGIPHVTFMVSTEIDTDHLIRLVERAEDLGMIAGVRGRASDLSAPSIVSDMAMAGLDHCNIVLVSADPVVHDQLCGTGDYELALAMLDKVQENEVAPVAEVPLLESTQDQLGVTLDLLLQAAISNVNFWAIAAHDELPPAQRSESLLAAALPQAANMVEELAAEMDVRFVWLPPVQREPTLILAEQIRAGPRCTADVSIRVEPDGDVIPPRGPNVAAGNILRDEWEDIWGNVAFLRYRERVEQPTRCEECPGLTICAADCPREPAGWSQGVGGEER